MEGVRQGLIQLRFPGIAFVGVQALIRVPDVRKTDPRLRRHLPADGVDDAIARVLFRFRAVDAVEHTARRQKPEDLLGGPRRIVRVDGLEHIPVHIVVSLRPILVAEKLAEPIGQHKRSDPFVNELVYDKRLRQSFEDGLLPLCKLISIHCFTLTF